jgi:hypothetical protein
MAARREIVSPFLARREIGEIEPTNRAPACPTPAARVPRSPPPPHRRLPSMVARRYIGSPFLARSEIGEIEPTNCGMAWQPCLAPPTAPACPFPCATRDGSTNPWIKFRLLPSPRASASRSREVLKELGKRVPDSLVKTRVKDDGFTIKYIPRITRTRFSSCDFAFYYIFTCSAALTAREEGSRLPCEDPQPDK